MVPSTAVAAPPAPPPVVVPAPAAPSAPPPPGDPAWDLYLRGAELAGTGNCTQAQEYFRSSLALARHQITLAALGDCELTLGYPEAAYEAYKAYLAMPDEGRPSEERQRVQERVQQFEAMRAPR